MKKNTMNTNKLHSMDEKQATAIALQTILMNDKFKKKNYTNLNSYPTNAADYQNDEALWIEYAKRVIIENQLAKNADNKWYDVNFLKNFLIKLTAITCSPMDYGCGNNMSDIKFVAINF